MLSKFSVKKPFTVFVAVVIIIVFGVISFMKMTPDLFPKINTPYVIVMTTYPGASPDEIETEISEPMEKQLATLTNMKNIMSISSTNYSVIQIEFSDDVNMDAVSVDIRDKIDQIEGNLPENAGPPVVMKINLDMVPIVTAAVGMKGKSPGEVSEFTKENLESPLEGVEGVASLSTMGMVEDNIQIVLSQEKIDQINEEVSDAVSGQMSSAKNQINSGISAAEKGKSEVQKGKKAVTDGEKQAAQQINAAKSKLEQSRSQLIKVKENKDSITQLYNQYQEAKSSGIQSNIETCESDIKAAGFSSADEFEKTYGQLETIDAQIEAIDTAISNLEAQSQATSFDLGTKYSDLAATESTLTSTVNQLQSALEEVQNSEQAALASADMTGVLTMKNVTAILNAQNFSMPAGYISDGKADLLVSVGDKITDKSELDNLILMDMDIDGVDPVKLKDIATVSYSNMGEDTYAKINGENGVLLSFTKQSSYATATVAENIKDEFAELEAEYEGLEFTTLSDQGEYIHIVINSVLQNLLLGAALAILILLFFLRDIRPTIITAVSIPISVIFAVALMYFTGVTLNMISLSGLAVGVGMLVDNSIVVIENIYRLRELGYSKIQAAVSGAVQVGGAITASTLTTICVFVPIVFVDGMTKDIFLDLALTIAYSLMASLLIALSLVPAMAKGMLRRETKNTIMGKESRLVHKYRNAVKWSLGHKKTVIICAIAFLFLFSGLALTRGFAFMPSMSTPQISATIQMPDKSTLEETSSVTDKITAEIKKVDGVETVGAMLASDTMGMMGMSAAEQDVTSTMLYIILEEDKAVNGKIITNKLDKLAEKYNCEITTSADMDMSAMMGGSEVEITLYSDDLDILRTTALKLESEMRKISSLEDVSDINEDSTEELRVVVDKNLAMKKGLTTAQVYQQIADKIARENTATTLSEAGSTLDVVVENSSAESFDRKDLENFKLTVDKKDGTKEKVTLSSIASIKSDASLNDIEHNNQKRTLKVTAGVKDGHNISKVTNQTIRMIKDKQIIPENVTADFGGENEEIIDAMKQMLLMLLVGFILVYLIMVAQFQSLRSPFIVIFTIPLAFTGGMMALFICGKEVSVVSMMGFVMLMGIVVNNAIVLVDCINRFRLEGMEMDEAVLNAGTVRIRPVLMTAITTIIGLLPLALGIGTGSEMIQPVALVCIGGLMYATITTLVVIPVMYKIFARKTMNKIEEEELEIVTA
ncbi:MAG: efflux RND transporter permease subunit [Bacillota bacterium]|nr:efflux RND transporter permease subunit [Bacillota bacterium]